MGLDKERNMKWNGAALFITLGLLPQAKQMEHVGVQRIFDNNSDQGMKIIKKENILKYKNNDVRITQLSSVRWPLSVT